MKIREKLKKLKLVASKVVHQVYKFLVKHGKFLNIIVITEIAIIVIDYKLFLQM